MSQSEHRRLKSLVEEIEQEIAETETYTGIRRLRRCIVEALRSVPRHLFVPPDLERDAYVNIPLPIGHGQTISQPYIVALMTELSGVAEHSVVLEVGTGSGYQAAVLAEIARQVYSVEIVPELARLARQRLAQAGYSNVSVREGDGAEGWPEHAPYDALVVTAAAPFIPAPLIAQLRPGGRLVIPVGKPWGPQELVLGIRQDDGSLHTRNVLPVAFVPLTSPDELAAD